MRGKDAAAAGIKTRGAWRGAPCMEVMSAWRTAPWDTAREASLSQLQRAFSGRSGNNSPAAHMGTEANLASENKCLSIKVKPEQSTVPRRQGWFCSPLLCSFIFAWLISPSAALVFVGLLSLLQFSSPLTGILHLQAVLGNAAGRAGGSLRKL